MSSAQPSPKAQQHNTSLHAFTQRTAPLATGTMRDPVPPRLLQWTYCTVLYRTVQSCTWRRASMSSGAPGFLEGRSLQRQTPSQALAQATNPPPRG